MTVKDVLNVKRQSCKLVKLGMILELIIKEEGKKECRKMRKVYQMVNKFSGDDSFSFKKWYPNGIRIHLGGHRTWYFLTVDD